jgi:hypothetical protein
MNSMCTVVVSGSSATAAEAAWSSAAAQKSIPQFVPPQDIVDKDCAELPSNQNAFMDYTKHVDAGPAGEAYRRQTENGNETKRATKDPIFLEAKVSISSTLTTAAQTRP